MRTAFYFAASVLLLAVNPVAWSQFPKPATDNTTFQHSVDRLGRDTPRGTILGFIRAASQDNFAKAALFLELPPNTSPKGAGELARQLVAAMNEGFHTPVGTINNRPAGSSARSHAGSIGVIAYRVRNLLASADSLSSMDG
jgi:hypothetical protein